MGSRYLIMDYETRATVPFGKRPDSVSPVVYAKHPYTDIMCCAWGFGKLAYLWIPQVEYFPKEAEEHILAGGSVEAHGKRFDQLIHEHIAVKLYGAPPIHEKQWRCSMARSALWTIPLALDSGAPAMKCTQVKDKEGSSHMKKICKPRPINQTNQALWYESDEDYLKLFEYCLQDYRTQRELSTKLPPFSKRELKEWRLDQKINKRGIFVDVPLCKKIQKRIEHLRIVEREKIRKATKGAITSETKDNEFLAFCKAKGVPLKNTQKDYLGELLKEDEKKSFLPLSVKKVLRFRLDFRRATVSKYTAILQRVDTDHRLKDAFVFAGAQRTARWAGKGAQPQNMFRSLVSYQPLITQSKELVRKQDFDTLIELYGSEMVAYGSMLRAMFCAPKGKVLYCADFSGVEARILFWLSDNYKYLRAIAAKKDPYIMLASDIFSKPYDQINSKERFFGKKGILSLGYGMGKDAFYQNCLDDPYVPHVTEEFISRIYDVYHEQNPETKRFWYKLEGAMKATVTSKMRHTVNDRVHCSYSYGDLFIHLPSGRKLRYAEARIKKGGLVCKATVGSGKAWLNYDFWGSKATGHTVQGLARDAMVHGMFSIEEAKIYPLVATVHDEGLSESRKGEGCLEEYLALMGSPIDYLEGCPIDVEGWEGDSYTK